jgi:hypothetical protein
MIQCVAVDVVWSSGGGCERGERAGAGVDVGRLRARRWAVGGSDLVEVFGGLR